MKEFFCPGCFRRVEKSEDILIVFCPCGWLMVEKKEKEGVLNNG